MEDLLTMPVTLVVKAANQKFDDHQVQCELHWTVRKLKEYLSEFYPSRPDEQHQKIIYSGRLLHDSLRLQDVLRKHEDDNIIHTVHLVCSPGAQQTVSDTSSQSSVSNPSTPASTPTSSPRASGLRHRHTNQSQETETQQQIPHQAHQQLYGAHPHNYHNMYHHHQQPHLMYNAMIQQGYTAAQIQWMQQMYHHQMAQYMQLVQQGAIPTPPASPQPNQAAEPPVNQNVVNNNQRQAANPNMVMNAQGGAVLDDEDENNRDWLDWIYTFSRFGILMSILYFYSSVSRFLMVFGLFVLVYIYHMGWFRLQRRVQPPPQQPPVQPVQQPQLNQPAENNQQNEDDNSDGIPEEEASNTPETPAEPPRPGAFSIGLNFLIGFFSSLIPQQPPAVNAN